jgi:NADH-quinone oxidoreductase subunit C
MNLKIKQRLNLLNFMLNKNEKQLIKILAPFIWKMERNNNNLIIHTTRQNLQFILSYLKLNSLYKFTQLIDIIASDFPEKKFRFSVNYNLLSILYSNRILIQIKTDEKIWLPSLISLYTSSNWLEREVLDMFGILFKKHNDLRRILTDYGFKGFPLRKDFSLTGYIDYYFNDRKQEIKKNSSLIFFQTQRLLLNV